MVALQMKLSPMLVCFGTFQVGTHHNPVGIGILWKVGVFFHEYLVNLYKLTNTLLPSQ